VVDKVISQTDRHPHPLTEIQREHVVEHYARAAPVMALDFPHVPIVGAWHDDGLGTPATFSGAWPGLPPAVVRVRVTTESGRHWYPGLTENAVAWLLDMGAVGILSWTPSPSDPQRVGYARILLRRCGAAGEQELKLAMLAMRTQLQQSGVHAIPVLDGHHGAALFVPFADAPAYDDVRAWLHRVCLAAAERHATLLTCGKTEEAGDRVHLAVSTNAVGRNSALPYSLAGNPGLHMVTPIEWNELGDVDNGTYTARTSAKRLERDVFAELAAVIGVQRFSEVR
jgi:bifunctional non-homologous end joining protein LigD